MIEEITVSFATTALLGLTMGFTACTAYCLPYFGSWVLGCHNRSHPWMDAVLFFVGRVVAYALLGGTTASLGRALLADSSIPLGRLVLSGVSLFAGFILFFQNNGQPNKSCVNLHIGTLPPLLLGVAVSIVPCPPLTALLAACALTGDITVGLLHGGLFGLTASLAPVVLVSVVLGRTGRALPAIFPWFSPWLRKGAALALVVLALQPLV